MTTVIGRVRATVRLAPDGVATGDGAACVVRSAWSPVGAFPRTAGTGVAFELETADGQLVRVEPFEALVAVPVRARRDEGGAPRELGWIAVGDEVTVEGVVEGGAPTRLRATRIALVDAGARTLHRLPPRALVPGEADARGARGAGAPPTPPAPAPGRRRGGRRHAP
jgi:hypothetical protein